jgi:hypothetical protein
MLSDFEMGKILSSSRHEHALSKWTEVLGKRSSENWILRLSLVMDRTRWKWTRTEVVHRVSL